MTQTKYIFVTGGVASGLGKGITAASLGRLLKARDYKVANQKFDPYINIDPSMMSPIQHGEIYVTEDGAECDADVGHYERFTDENLTADSNITSGKIYQAVMDRERKGYYGGKTVQVIPHITDYIKHLTKNVAKSRTPEPEIVITEIGGTAGDIESLPFMEAIRQMAFDVGRENVVYIHVTLLPYLEKGGEIKTKPTQHSVKTLLSLGIQPDIIVCRTTLPLDGDIRDKLSLFCNVPKEAIVQNIDCDTIYDVPLLLEEESLAKVALKKLGLTEKTPNLTEWKNMLEVGKNAANSVKISIVGKYTILPDAYLSLIEALKAATFATSTKVDINWVAAEDVEKGNLEILADCQGIIIASGFGERGFEGKVAAAKYARESNIPCLGIGMGMQAMAVDFARNVMNLTDANSAEFHETTPHPIFYNPSTGLRKGAYDCIIAKNSLAHSIYASEKISERHRHRYEFDKDYIEKFEGTGMMVSGKGNDGKFAEIIELPSNKFHFGVLFAPQFKSRPNRPHPIFTRFVEELNNAGV